MKWIGLTGGIACGKSTVAKMLAERGVPVKDADQIVHSLLAPNSAVFAKVVHAFGPKIVDASGQIDRRTLGQVVFADLNQLQKLELILHPEVRKATAQWRHEMETKGEKLAVYDVPLLFEKNMRPDFDEVIVVACDPSIQNQRMIERNNWTKDEIARRLAAQIPLSEKIASADYVIHNNGTVEDLRKEVEKVLRSLHRR